jgi:hypothetical protein
MPRCEYEPELRVARCPVFGNSGTSWDSRLVTDIAQWESNATNVVVVVRPGVLAALSVGEAIVTVTLNGPQIREKFCVVGTYGAPLRVSMRESCAT